MKPDEGTETHPMEHPLKPLPLAIAGGTAAIILFGALLYWNAQSHVNKVALVSTPKGVTVIDAKEAMLK